VKTAVSIPDPVFDAADRMAQRLGVSRSEFYTRAIRVLLERESDDAVTARLDALYDAEPSRIPEPLARTQRRAVSEQW
jgi:metal-responsive CopG/Arc/MetJ family transcriptional regulator